jgi:hypothetical protein
MNETGAWPGLDRLGMLLESHLKRVVEVLEEEELPR